MENERFARLRMREIGNKPRTAGMLACGIALLSFLMNFLLIGQSGYGNAYYAAAIRSMTQSLHNFFFISFDPAGVVAVDKPPVGLWVQALFVMAFGYHGWAMLLPQALAGAGSTYMTYRLTNKYFGPGAGLTASLAFALTPAAVVASRNNTMDMQLLFVLLCAAWFFCKALDTGKWRHLLYAALLVGLGFNIKMLQAYLILPAMALTYLIFAKEKFGRRLLKCVGSLAVIVALSLVWVLAVDLTPAQNRPYVGSSANNTVLELIFGHNGLERLDGGFGGRGGRANFGAGDDGQGIGGFGQDDGGRNRGGGPDGGFGRDGRANPPQMQGGAGDIGGFAMQNRGMGGAGNDIGSPGLLRLWSGDLYGQISWLLPLAALGLVFGLRRGEGQTRRMRVFWGIYLLTTAAFFSFAGFWHRYYLCMMAPGIAVLTGIGAVDAYRAFRDRDGWRQWLLPAALLLTAGIAVYEVYGYEQVRVWLVPVIIGLAAVSLILMALSRAGAAKTLRRAAMGAMLLSVLAGPFYWALTAVLYVPENVTLPYAGPELASIAKTPGMTANQEPFSGATGDMLLLEQYLVAHYTEGTYLVVAQRANDVADFIVDTGLPAVAYGGFLGSDNAMTLDRLKELAAAGTVTYFLVTSGGGGGSELVSYVQQNAALVDSSEYGASGSSAGRLYRFG